MSDLRGLTDVVSTASRSGSFAAAIDSISFCSSASAAAWRARTDSRLSLAPPTSPSLFDRARHAARRRGGLGRAWQTENVFRPNSAPSTVAPTLIAVCTVCCETCACSRAHAIGRPLLLAGEHCFELRGVFLPERFESPRRGPPRAAKATLALKSPSDSPPPWPKAAARRSGEDRGLRPVQAVGQRTRPGGVASRPATRAAGSASNPPPASGSAASLGFSLSGSRVVPRRGPVRDPTRSAAVSCQTSICGLRVDEMQLGDPQDRRADRPGAHPAAPRCAATERASFTPAGTGGRAPAAERPGAPRLRRIVRVFAVSA